MAEALILTINTGSSSLKAAAYQCGAKPKRIFAASVKHIGDEKASIEIEPLGSSEATKQSITAATQVDALKGVLEAFEALGASRPVDMVGHRVVHGGMRFTQSCRLDTDAIQHLEQLVDFAPDHMPQALDAIKFFREHNQHLAQMAAFDTTFHRQMPVAASSYALPPSYAAQGLKRYGFHGLSYTYIVQELLRLRPDLTGKRLVVAHLGSGASMAAIHNGRSVDTSMGFSPDAGLVMSSRAGDIDAAAVLHLIEHEGMSPASVRSLLNQRAGLLGLSGTSADMQTLLGQVDTDANAAAAVDMFCYRARRTLGGYIAVLGGIDALVFTGGIGENSAEIRKRICGDLAFLGIEIDQEENGKNSRVISSNGSPVHIRVMSTDEDLIIAQEALALLRLK